MVASEHFPIKYHLKGSFLLQAASLTIKPHLVYWIRLLQLCTFSINIKHNKWHLKQQVPHHQLKMKPWSIDMFEVNVTSYKWPKSYHSLKSRALLADDTINELFLLKTR